MRFGKGAGSAQPFRHRQRSTGEPCILPGVGGEDGGGGAFVQNIYMPTQGIYAIGVQHHRDVQVLQQGAHQLLGLGVAAQAGTDESHVAAPCLLQNFFVLLRQREGHSLVTLDSQDGVDLTGHTQKDQSRSRAQGCPGGQVRSSGVALAPCQEKELAKIPLVSVHRAAGQIAAHIAGHAPALLRSAPNLTVEQLPGDANINSPNLSGPARAGIQIETGLDAGEGDDHLGLDRVPQDFSRVPVYSGGQVAGDHRGVHPVEPLHQSQKFPRQRALKSHPEQGVHKAVAGGHPDGGALVIEIQGFQLTPGLSQLFLHSPLVRRHLCPVSHQEGPNPVACLQQDPGGGHAVPSVVARSAENTDALGRIGVFGLHNGAQLFHLPLLLESGFFSCLGHKADAGGPIRAFGIFRRTHQIHHRLGHRLGGVLHQLQGWNAPLLNGDAVQFLHLCRAGQNLHAAALLSSGTFLHIVPRFCG